MIRRTCACTGATQTCEGSGLVSANGKQSFKSVVENFTRDYSGEHKTNVDPDLKHSGLARGRMGKGVLGIASDFGEQRFRWCAGSCCQEAHSNLLSRTELLCRWWFTSELLTVLGFIMDATAFFSWCFQEGSMKDSCTLSMEIGSKEGGEADLFRWIWDVVRPVVHVFFVGEGL